MEQLQLKNIKVVQSMSQETFCYSASLYHKGEKIGIVSNRGFGACDDFDGNYRVYDALDTWCRENLPKWSLDGFEGEHQTTLEHWCHQEINFYLQRKDLKRQLKTKALFIPKTLEGENYYSIPIESANKCFLDNGDLSRLIGSDYKDYIYLNALEPEERERLWLAFLK